MDYHFLQAIPYAACVVMSQIYICILLISLSSAQHCHYGNLITVPLSNCREQNESRRENDAVQKYGCGYEIQSPYIINIIRCPCLNKKIQVHSFTKMSNTIWTIVHINNSISVLISISPVMLFPAY